MRRRRKHRQGPDPGAWRLLADAMEDGTYERETRKYDERMPVQFGNFTFVLREPKNGEGMELVALDVRGYEAVLQTWAPQDMNRVLATAFEWRDPLRKDGEP